MSDKYARRTTVLFKRGDSFDEELLAMLGKITPKNNISTKLKELALGHLKLIEPKLYEEVVKELELELKNEDIKVNTKKKESKEEDIRSEKAINGVLNY